MGRRRRPPRLVRLEERLAPAIAEFLDPHPAPGNGFGSTVLPLSTGHVVVTAPFDDAGGTDAGAVYLFNGRTGALISTLRGSRPNDRVGCGSFIGGDFGTAIYYGGVMALANGNFLVLSPYWSNGVATQAGAVTFGNGLTGVSGMVSAANSLVGHQANDRVGSYFWQGFQNYGVTSTVTTLSNGNYVVVSRQWDNGFETDAGAVTLCDGVTGTSGLVLDVFSLTGTTADDQVGSGGVMELTNGNFVISSPYWDNGLAADAGAVSFGDGTTGAGGDVSPANSLVGSSKGDLAAYHGVVPLPDGNYLVCSGFWDNGGATDSGAVSFGSGTSGVSGAIGANNSLVGTSADDNVGYYGAFGTVVVLANGNYIVRSPSWDNGPLASAGAVTFGSGSAGVTGPITPFNSLVGTTAGDGVGGSFLALDNGNYVVQSPYWDNGAVVDAGAATFGSGTAGVTGAVSPANSLVGSAANDRVGYGVTPLANGNYVVRSPYWDSGALADTGAVTFAGGTAGVSGPVSPANSLVGTSKDDGLGSVTALTNGNYVVYSSGWDNGGVVNVGIALLCNGTSGTTGFANASNALTGSQAHDRVGDNYVIALANGNYVVLSPRWRNGAAAEAGAATFGHGTTGVAGPVSATNSLVGVQQSDFVGGSGAVALPNGNYVVRSSSWRNGASVGAGASTFGNGTTGVSGPVGAANSLVGSAAYDHIGSFVTPLANANYVVSSPYWYNGPASSAGAATFANGSAGVTGLAGPSNSLTGTASYDQVGGQHDVTPLANGNYVVRSASWGGGAGAVTFGNGATGVSGPVSTANSIAGSVLSSGLQAVILHNQNGTYYCPFIRDGGGRVRVGSQVYGFTPPKVASVAVNGGAAQRSRVTAVKVTFDQLVVLPANPADAFRLTRQSDGATPGLSAVVDDTGPGTAVTLTFTGATAVEAGSLADGRYTLTVLKAGVNAGHFDGNGDGLAGDDYLLVGTPANGLFRLFGDADGDGDTDAVDFRAARAAFVGVPNFAFDADGDGDLDAADFGAFRLRYGMTV